MEGYFILLFSSFGSCISEWVLLPPLPPKQDKLKSHFSSTTEFQFPAKNSSHENTEFCPDFHNLTTMGYGTLYKEESHPRTGWEISLQDVEDLLKEKEKLPKTPSEKANLVKQIGEDLMDEAEEQIKALFSPRREARTKYFHGPSMESALMTISMLLFGVFISKLIHKLLVSHYRYTGGVAMMTGIRAPINLAHGRRRRSTEFHKINLMHLIDKYNTRFNHLN